MSGPVEVDFAWLGVFWALHNSPSGIVSGFVDLLGREAAERAIDAVGERFFPVRVGPKHVNLRALLGASHEVTP